MADQYLITNLSDGLGFIIQDISGFIVGFFSGWILMLSILTIGVILALYFRFFKNTARSISQ